MKLAPSMPSCLVVDSSILIFFDRKGQLEDFLRQKKKENYKVIIPKAIAQEVVDEPQGFAEEIREIVFQLYDKANEKVFIATLDKGLLKALKPFSKEAEYEVLERL